MATAADYLATAIEAYEVDAVFLVPTVLSDTLVAMEQHTDIRRVVTHGEKAAAYMADGYARSSGRLGVCMAQNVGAANLAAGLRDAYLGSSPVLALTGGPYETSRGRHYYQEIEDFPLFKPVTKVSGQVHDAARLPDMLAHAVRTSMSGRPGPVHLELAGHTGDVLEAQELDAEVPQVPHRLPAPVVQPDPDAVRRAAEVLRGARRPVIVAGGGVRTGGAGAQVLALAEQLQAPVATSLNAKSVVPADHSLAVGVPGLYARGSANQVLVEADLVLFVGTQTGSQLTLTWTVPPIDVQVIQIDVEPTELGRHYPRTVGIQGDAGRTVDALREAVEDHRLDGTWARRAQDLGRAWQEENREYLTSEAIPMRPERLSSDVGRLLPDDALLVADTGHAGMWTGGYVDLREGQDYIRAAGSLGWGLPAALGAALGRPDRPVALFTGDGGLWYHVAELETAARWDIPAVIVVNDNRSLNQEINPYTKAYGGSLTGRHHELWHFQDIDLAALASAFGVGSRRVTRPGDLDSAFDEAFSHGGPFLLDVVTDMEVVAPKGVATPAAR
ncbi:thiamine pyrophosphate-binding protein [Nocardioides sp. LHG3406-4]|uniref:thiamine pyrophosphate-binding protein n=1 Tax=Nocardioides sp. LHG3406-4 TaxID=2804575 RepID=UPI003CF79E34